MSPNETAGDRYSLPGLIALYAYEPSLRDVYVEGRVDVGLLTWYLRESGLDEAAVFAIDDRLDILASDLPHAGLEVNARGRAIALAAYCDKELGNKQLGVTVVVDADFDHLAGVTHLTCLHVTDHPTMEGYVLAERPLEKLLRVSLHQPRRVTASMVRAAVIPALNDICAVRFVLHSVSIACIDDIASVCTLSTEASAADMRELLRRSLTGVRKDEWPESLDKLTARARVAREAVSRLGLTGRGHDIAPVLIAFLELKGVAANRESLEMAMRSCFEAEDLDGQPLFEALKARLAA